ncbi:MAG TPA: CCA tRNA nucleotidyltransferase [Sulfolobales archaeon]|nr:CCA tRNA nucleotidyltransferase [Sulfolobales archaeon]
MNREDAWRIALEVLGRIRPSESEIRDAYRVYNIIKERLSGVFRDGFSIDLYGSIAKGTAISGDLDLDIFVLVPRELGTQWIKRNFVGLARKALGDIESEERYAEHPYLRVRVGGFEADIVPAIKVERASEALTAADRTPFHTEYVRRMLREDLKDHVRLLKKFMKSVGVYGAEIKVGGFSGYVAELLIISYGGFLEVLERASRWRPPVIIIPPGAEDKISVDEARKLFKGSALIIPDPVDVRRNAGAAVTIKSLSSFTIASKLYLERPSISFFEPPEISEDRVKTAISKQKRRGSCIIAIQLRLGKSAPDNIWGEIKSLSRRIYNRLSSESYPVLRRDEYWDEASDKALVILELLSCSPEEPIHLEGPPANVDNSLDFIEKQLSVGEGFWIDDHGRLHGVRRRNRSAVEAIERIISTSPLPRDIVGVEKIYLDPEEILKTWDESKGFREWLACFLESLPRYLMGLGRD